MSKVKFSKTGAFEARIRFGGKSAWKTMFPANWRPKEVMESVEDALQNVYEIVPQQFGRLRFRCLSSSGMKIQLITEADGTVVTFHPLT